MVGEFAAEILLLVLFVAMVVAVLRFNRIRDICSKCGDVSEPAVSMRSSLYPKQDFSELVVCKACGHKWKRMPKIDSGGG